MKRDDACINLRNSEGQMCRCILKNALYIPTFKQNIFSVKAVTKNGAHISFECDNYQLIYPNGAVFNITEKTSVLFEKYCLCQKCHLQLIHMASNLRPL